MKKLLLVAGATLAVVGGGAASASHYDQYKNKQHQAEVSATQQAVQQAKADQQKADQVTLASVTTAKESLQVECEKGVTAYAKLPLSVQKTLQKPSCTL